MELENKTAVRNIPKIIEQYANTLGCAIFIESKNVVQFKIDNERDYVALFSFDVGCSGGSAMSRPVFVLLTSKYSYPKIYIEGKYSIPSQTSEAFPSQVDSIYVENGKLKYKAREYNFATDPLSSPSVVVTGEVEFKNGFWQPKPQEK